MRSSASPSRVLPSGWLLASEPGPGGRTASAAGETTCARTLPDRHQCRVDEEDRPAGGRDARGLEGKLRRAAQRGGPLRDRKSTRLNSSHTVISYAVFCLK